MGGKPGFHEPLQLFREFGGGLVAGTRHDECLDEFGAFRVGLADDRGFHYCRVLDQRALDVVGPMRYADEVMMSSARPMKLMLPSAFCWTVSPVTW